VLFAPAAIQFLLALEWGGTQYPWSSSTVIGLFCGAAGNFAIFVGWEYRKGEAAMIPLSMVKQKVVASSCVVVFFFFGSAMTMSYYLPIYFQAVRGVTPTLSGVYTLPAILSQMLFAILSGYLGSSLIAFHVFIVNLITCSVSKFGYYLLWSALSGILTSIGLGLISTYTPQTSAGVWIGYQIIAGAGRGCGVQMASHISTFQPSLSRLLLTYTCTLQPIVAIQNFLPQENVSVGMSLVIFAQTLGGALFLTFAETVFTNGLIQALSIYAPEANSQAIIDAGATAVRDVVPTSSLAGVLLAYDQAVSHAFYLAAGAAVATVVFCWGMGWKGVKKGDIMAEDEVERGAKDAY
jgi:hypothetical protein